MTSRVAEMTHFMRIFGLALLTLGLILTVSACGATPPTPARTPVTVQLNWLHYGVFGGLYAADQNGYYADEGLDVEFISGGPDVDYITPVVDGDAHFGIAGGDALLLARAEGAPVRAVATILQRSPVALIAPAESGITRPQDLVGTTIRTTPQLAPAIRAMMMRAGIAPEQYTEVVLPSDMELFAEGDVPVWGVYMNSFAVEAEQAGYDLNYIYVEDYGVHFYSDSIFTSQELIEDDPELVTRFLRASLKGLQFAIENPDDAGAMIRAYDPKADVAIEQAKMRATVPLVHTGQQHLGWMEADVWSGMYDVLHEEHVLTQQVNVDDVYTLRFLQHVHGDRQ